jgi:hypothetical protein
MTAIRSVRHRALGIMVLGAAASCGGADGDGLSQATAQSFLGLYQLDTATENPTACDVEGPSALDTVTQRQFALVDLQVLTISGLQLLSCTDDADCGSKITRLRSGTGFAAEYSWYFSEERGTDHVGGGRADSGFETGGLCTMRSFTDVSMTRQGEMVRVEARETLLADIPPEDGFCIADFGKERSEASGRPCSSLQVWTGTRRGPLP